MFYLEQIFRTEVQEAASQVTLRELLRGECVCVCGGGCMCVCVCLGVRLHRSFTTTGK